MPPILAPAPSNGISNAAHGAGSTRRREPPVNRSRPITRSGPVRGGKRVSPAQRSPASAAPALGHQEDAGPDRADPAHAPEQRELRGQPATVLASAPICWVRGMKKEQAAENRPANNAVQSARGCSSYPP